MKSKIIILVFIVTILSSCAKQDLLVDIPIIKSVVSGEVQGSFTDTDNEQTVEFKHVYVSREEDSFGKYGIEIVLTDKPLPEPVVQDTLKSMWLGKVNSVSITFTPPLNRMEDASRLSNVHIHTLLGNGMMQGSFSASFDPSKFVITQLNDEKIVAKIDITPQGKSLIKMSLQANIDAPIRTVPPILSQQELAEIKKSVLGQAIDAFISAVLSGDKQAVKQTVTKASQALLDEPDADKGLKIFKDDLSTMQLTKLRRLQGNVIKIEFTEEQAGSSRSKGLSLLQEDGVWKISLVQPGN